LELQKRAYRRLLDARDAAAHGGSQSERNRYRFLIVQQQRWQSCTCAQLVASCGSRGRVDGISQAAQPIDIAAQGPPRDSEPMGKIGSGPVALHLKKGEKTEQPG